MGWGYGLMVKYLPSMHEVIDSTISIAKTYAISHVQEAAGMTSC